MDMERTCGEGVLAQWEGGGLAILGLLLSTISLALLDLWLPSASVVPQALLMVAVSAFVGVLRFLALRGWVFSERAPTDRLRLHHAGRSGNSSGPPTSAMPTSR
ncbi:hypothetical protein [Rhodococcus sp. WAY2]|uniref:hypothetical protein n=1 Tax=Rhodococcus sp. WAY2 TaxID=2663121 RepID=UPI00131FA338|nr:hypothetical protein [Rhodococcus sp. WAY2]QHE66774.1 putative glycosyl transferase [Rhodococcus sp. WAY2]